MGLNTAGLNALLEDGNDAVVYVAIGDGATSTDQTSTARVQVTWTTPASGAMSASNVPIAFTGTAAAGATDALLFSASTGGTFYGSQALTGDQAFNADGDYSLTALTVTLS